jgi:hypothetical protein
MIGAEQVDASIGRLVRSRYTEYMPLLGAFIFASDQFVDAKSGFAIYNLTAGITTTDVAGWFSRWCLMQDFERSHSKVTWTVDRRERRRGGWWMGPAKADRAVATCIGIVVHATLLAITVLQGDWWGLANAVSMTISVVVRAYVVQRNREALDMAAENMPDQSSESPKEEKVLVVLSDAKMVTMYVPYNIVYSCFVSKPNVRRKGMYYGIRMLGWAGFAVQVISLGMSGLATQIITVSLMVVSTIATHLRVGCQDDLIGTRLHAHRCDFPPERPKRKDIYVALDLKEHEEESMLAWNLMPHKSTPGAKDWWADYEQKKAAYTKLL